MEEHQDRARQFRYEVVSAVFGWIGALSLAAGLVAHLFSHSSSKWFLGIAIPAITYVFKRDIAKIIKRYEDTGKLS